MGFLQSGDKQDAAATIRGWYIDGLYLIQDLETKRNSLINQLELMKVNIDYTQEDCDEVQGLIDELNSKISLL